MRRSGHLNLPALLTDDHGELPDHYWRAERAEFMQANGMRSCSSQCGKALVNLPTRRSPLGATSDAEGPQFLPPTQVKFEMVILPRPVHPRQRCKPKPMRKKFVAGNWKMFTTARPPRNWRPPC